MSAPLELVIGVDLGGTKTRAAVVDREGELHDRVEFGTPEDSEEDVLAALDAAIERLLDDRIAALGYGIPSNLQRETRRILRSTNLTLDDFDLLGHARSKFGLPVGIENDGNAAALAEWRFGAGKDASTIVMLTLGTGVGGGLVLDGQLYRGWAEVGHVVLQAGGPPCQGNCHGRGHIEALVSGTAADAVAIELYGPEADAQVLVSRAREGDDEASTRLRELGELLGAALGSLANMFDPDLIVVGGGFGLAAAELLLEPAQEAARREAIAPADTTLRVVPAELEEAGLVGAGLVAFEALDGAR